jgi:hypothetical protein
MSDNPRPYVCQRCNYVLGFVMRGSDRRPKLSVLRLSAHADQLEALVDMALHGTRSLYSVMGLEQGEVICLHCGAGRVWSMSEAAIENLLERRRARTFGLEVEDGRKEAV